MVSDAARRSEVVWGDEADLHSISPPPFGGRVRERGVE
jgi:hypothetical protein